MILIMFIFNEWFLPEESEEESQDRIISMMIPLAWRRKANGKNEEGPKEWEKGDTIEVWIMDVPGVSSPCCGHIAFISIPFMASSPNRS